MHQAEIVVSETSVLLRLPLDHLLPRPIHQIIQYFDVSTISAHFPCGLAERSSQEASRICVPQDARVIAANKRVNGTSAVAFSLELVKTTIHHCSHSQERRGRHP